MEKIVVRKSKRSRIITPKSPWWKLNFTKSLVLVLVLILLLPFGFALNLFVLKLTDPSYNPIEPLQKIRDSGQKKRKTSFIGWHKDLG